MHATLFRVLFVENVILDITHSVSFVQGWDVINTSQMGLPILRSFVLFRHGRDSNVSFSELKMFLISRCACFSRLNNLDCVLQTYKHDNELF